VSALWTLLFLLAGLAGGLVLTAVFFAVAFTTVAGWVHARREFRESAD
jgi:hypothetical protein